LHARQVGEEGIHAVITEAGKAGLQVDKRVENMSPGRNP
jgi:hypothetical protein